MHGRITRRKPLLTNLNTKTLLKFQQTSKQKKKHDPPDLGKIFCGLTRQEFKFLEGLNPATSGIKPTTFY